MKKYKIIILMLIISTFRMNVFATEAYYTNSYNVSLNEEEYNFISELFYEGYQESLTCADYDNIFKDNTLQGSIYSKRRMISTFSPLGATHTTNSKEIKIAKSCSSNCLVTITVTWLKAPIVRSYDLIGVLLENTSLIGNPTTTITYSSHNDISNDYVKKTNGFGASIKIGEAGINCKITQYFRAGIGGKIYASYQHAVKNITLADSKEYDISLSGYGRVFLFNNSTIRSYYDGMGGVDIEL